MTKQYLVTLSDVTTNRATAMSVRAVTPEQIAPNRETGRSPIHASHYAIVSDAELVPSVGERVWIAAGESQRERVITARA